MESSLARCPSSKLERMRTTTGFLSKPAEFESTLSVSVRFHFIVKIINLISDFFNTPQNRVGSWFPRALNFGFKILFRNYDLIVVLYSTFFLSLGNENNHFLLISILSYVRLDC